MICVSYTRTTSCSLMEKAASDIISIQNKKIAEYASKRKWKIEKKYSDRRNDREEDTAFRALKEDGISKKYDCVVFDSMLRFGTTGYHAYDLLALVFLPAGIHFAVVEDDFCSMDYGREETLQYLGHKRQDYRRLHTKETNGRYLEKRVYEKYGYRHKDGVMELEIDEEAAENIRMVFALLCEGNTFKQTADIMTEKGIEPPNLYMRRMGMKGRNNERNCWLPSQIGNMVRNPLYIGQWIRTINCEKVICPCPPIISEEMFRKASEKCMERQKNLRNAKRKPGRMLSGIFFDFDSGWPIYQYRSITSDEKLYRLKYPKPEYMEYPKMCISYDEVERAVRELLHKEQEKAWKAVRMFDSPEFQTMKEQRMAVIREKAQIIFKRMLQLEYMTWQEQASDPVEEQRRNDEELQAYFLQMEELETVLSEKNPWIQLYSGMKLSDHLTTKEIKKWILSASCEKFEKVRIEIKERDAFLQLPQEWFEEE